MIKRYFAHFSGYQEPTGRGADSAGGSGRRPMPRGPGSRRHCPDSSRGANEMRKMRTCCARLVSCWPPASVPLVAPLGLRRRLPIEAPNRTRKMPRNQRHALNSTKSLFLRPAPGVAMPRSWSVCSSRSKSYCPLPKRRARHGRRALEARAAKVLLSWKATADIEPTVVAQQIA